VHRIAIASWSRAERALSVALLLVAGLGQAQPLPGTTVERQGDAIVFRGRIDDASATTFLQLLQEPGVRRLVITSPGGLVIPALDMAEALAARGLDVEVPEACFSSCANYVFLAGRRKLLGGPAVVGWHGNMTHVLHLQQIGEGRWTRPEVAAAHVLAQREAAFFQRIGVDGFVCWFAKLPPYNVEDFYALTPQDMAVFGIREVSVRAGGVPPYAPPGVQMVSVDRAGLEAVRPAVPLE
jgi:hypothetical protein